jgi:hypothetical protein
MERAVLLGSGLLVAAVGALIRYAGWVELVAGYDPERVTDEEGLAEFVGRNVLAVGVLTVLLGAVEAVTPGGETWYWLGYVAVVLGIGLWTVRGARRFESPGGDEQAA